MRSILLVILSSVQIFASSAAIAGEKASILTNALAMTMTQALLFPEKDNSTRGKVSVIPGRENTFLYEKEGQLHFTYQIQKDKNAPLIFIIPGTGGVSESPGALALAEQLYAQGYHTVTIDDAFSFRFAVAGSRSSLPGYTPNDADDLYFAMQTVNQSLIAKKEINPSSYSLLGYSLGGLQGVFIHRMDEKQKKFNFRKTLFINPPMDLMHAVTSLDEMYAYGDKLGRGRKLTVFNRVLEVGGNLLNSHDLDYSDPSVLQKAFDELGFDNQDLSYVVGGSFRSSLQDVIFVSQQVNDLKILKSPVSLNKRNQRYEEAGTFTFAQYLSQFVFPNVMKKKGAGYSQRKMNDEVSFYQFGDYVRSHKSIYLIHSQDDFILKNGDVTWMKNKFGNRAMILPYGGHCGAMNFPQVKAQVKAIFQN